MAKMTKELTWRLEGMLAAYKIAESKGLEALKKDITMRKILKIDIWAKKGEVEKLEREIANNVYASMISTFLYSLHNVFGFGKDRLCKIKAEYDKNLGKIDDLDYLGQHYVRFKDYGVYLNEKYGFNFDVDRLDYLQDAHDSKENQVGKCDLQRVLQELRNNGFESAALFLESKLDYTEVEK